jgi:predicted SnoaL-like aldol condensation-catalyzing enzyme
MGLYYARKEGVPMTNQKEAQRAFAARWFEEVWNKSRREAIDEMFPEGCVLHDGQNVYRGPEEFKLFYDALRAQLTHVRITLLDVIAEGDMVCQRWSSTATEASTGKRVEVTGMSFLRFENGRFVEGWQNWDQYGMVQQLERKAPEAFAQAAG